MTRHELEHLVPPLATPVRLDKYVADVLALFPRSQLERRGLEVQSSGKPVKPSLRLAGGERLSLAWQDLPEASFEAQDLDLEVIYEDAEVIVVNKARGMVVHPAHGHRSGTLVQGLLHRVEGLAEQFEEEDGADLRPGIVHRLDKETTGVLIAAKTPAALEFLAAQFRDRSTQKTYFAVLKGLVTKDRGLIDVRLGRDSRQRQRYTAVGPGQGKPAVTEWTVLARAGGCTLVEFRPHTGRTHQLRVHALIMGHPILGDPVYARADPRWPGAPLMLHAGRLLIEVPSGGRRAFSVPPPPDFLQMLRRFGLPDPPNGAPG